MKKIVSRVTSEALGQKGRMIIIDEATRPLIKAAAPIAAYIIVFV